MKLRRFELTILLTIALILATAGRYPARADIGEQMTFRLIPSNGPYSRPAIEADGDFKADTPTRFEAFLAANRITQSLPPPQRPMVFFTSGGGVLVAGLELGRIIRRYGLDTTVGAQAPIPGTTQRFLERNYQIPVTETCPPSGLLPTSCKLDRDTGKHASYCVSACTIAFLGGVSRSMVEGSTYAVHQFGADCKRQPSAVCSDAAAAMAEAQTMSAMLSTYLEEMGIPQAFLTDMVLADPAHVTVLSYDAMVKYRVLYVPITEQWDVKRSTGGLVLVYEEQTGTTNTSVEFACAARGGNAPLTLLIVGDHNDDHANALSARPITFRFFPDNRPMREYTLSPDEIARPPYSTQGNGVGLILRTSSRIIDALRTTGHFQVLASVMGPLNIEKLVVYANVPLDRDKLDGYIAGCR